MPKLLIFFFLSISITTFLLLMLIVSVPSNLQKQIENHNPIRIGIMEDHDGNTILVYHYRDEP